MRLIRKTGAPASFQTYIRAVAASYDNMDKEVKDELLVSLIAEQYGVCAYCQQHLNPNTATIEHHCERSICNGENGTNDRRLEYRNLMAVCPGVIGNPTETHCDTRKAERAQENPTAHGLPMQVNPTIAAHIPTFTYSSTGVIKSKNTTYEKEINHLLNLNAKDLKRKRQNKFVKIMRSSSDKGKTGFNKKKLKKVLTDDLSLRTKVISKKGNPLQKAQVFQNDTPGMSEYMLKVFC